VQFAQTPPPPPLDAEDLTVDGLTRDWNIVQRRRGHRHSTDDLLTAWYAAEKAPDPVRVLDLGSGIGSVGLLVLWRSPRAHLTAVEAQEVSFQLLERNVARNDLGARVRAVHGDLRATRFPGEAFDLVTGSPPYFDVRDGIVPADSQKAHARFELRGDVNDYCAAARAALASNGRFVFCFPTVQRARAERACDRAELAVVSSRDVLPRRGVAPLFSLFACRRREDGTGDPMLEPPHAVRDEAGSQTPEHAAARATFGMGSKVVPPRVYASSRSVVTEDA
jgi:tRNA1(Val) A37 N6-methylase TrmN6